MVETITALSADELLKLEFQKRLKQNITADLADGTKYAVCLVKLAGAVTPGDYLTLKADIEAVTGVQEVSLLIDHQTKAAVPADHTQVLSVRADIDLRDDTPGP